MKHGKYCHLSFFPNQPLAGALSNRNAEVGQKGCQEKPTTPLIWTLIGHAIKGISLELTAGLSDSVPKVARVQDA